MGYLVTWWAGSSAWRPNQKQVSFSRRALSDPLPLAKQSPKDSIKPLRGLNKIIWVKFFVRCPAVANIQYRLLAIIMTNIAIGLS